VQNNVQQAFLGFKPPSQDSGASIFPFPQTGGDLEKSMGGGFTGELGTSSREKEGELE